MSHGVNGAATFIDDFERKRFLEHLREIVDAGNLLVHAFCLMINHFHVLCETPKSGLSRHIQLVKNIEFRNRIENMAQLLRKKIG